MLLATLAPSGYAQPAAVSSAEQSNVERHFALPADLATRTFKLFSQQAEVQLLFPTDLVKDLRTRPVHGLY
ncbi:MAG: hypothetical protein ABIV50_02270, partial [Opitutus sp.]